jgi:hypothetical protein
VTGPMRRSTSGPASAAATSTRSCSSRTTHHAEKGTGSAGTLLGRPGRRAGRRSRSRCARRSSDTGARGPSISVAGNVRCPLGRVSTVNRTTWSRNGRRSGRAGHAARR